MTKPNSKTMFQSSEKGGKARMDDSKDENECGGERTAPNLTMKLTRTTCSTTAN